MNEIQHLETFNATAEGNGWPTAVSITDTEWNLKADEIEAGKININVAVDLNLDGFMGIDDHSNNCFKKATLSAEVHGDVTADQVAELGKRVDNRCPILSVLRSSGCTIDSSWKQA